MADQKISELTALTGADLADVDAFAVVDTSAIQTKKITYAELKTALDTGTGFVRITGDTMTGNLIVPQVEIGDGSAGGTSELLFSDNVSARGKIKYNHGSNPEVMTLETTGTVAITIDNSQNVGINATPTQKLHVGGNAIITGLTRLGNGTESSPAYQFVDDTNTGMYRSSSDVLGFSTGGANRLTLNSTGATFAGDVYLTSSTPIIRLTDTDTNAYSEISGSSSDGNLMFYADQGNSQANTTIRFYVDSSEKARLDSAGTLFLGTTSPTLHSSMTGIVLDNGSLLNDVSRGASKSLTLAQNLAVDSGNTWAYLSTDEGSYYQQFNGNHYFGTAPSGSAGANATVTSKLTILNDGKVGISKDNPEHDLHVTSESDENDGIIKLGGSDTSLGLEISYDQASVTTTKIISNPTYGNAGALMHIAVDGDTNPNQLVLQGDGMTGIGTAAPKRHLHINGGNETTKIQITNQTTGSSSDGDGFQIGIATDGTANIEQRENNDLAFYTNNTLRQKIDSAGHVMIGTTVEGVAGAEQLTVAGSGNTGITIRAGSSSSSAIYMSDATSGSGEYGGYIAYAHNTGILTFATGSAGRMTISEEGTTTISGTYSTTNSVNNVLRLQSSSSGTAVAGHGTGIQFLGERNDGNAQTLALIQSVTSTNSGTSIAGDLVFHTGSGGAPSERMRIDSSGRVGIGNAIPGSFHAGANNLVVGSGSGSEGITIYGGAESNIFFADGTATADNLRGRIEYSHGLEKMLFYVNNSNAMNIDSSGAVTIPSQPAFSVHKNGTDQSNFALNTDVTVTWSHSRFDQNSDFDFVNGRFTAPVIGKYQLNGNILLENLDGAADYYIVYLHTSNAKYRFIFDPDFMSDSPYWSVAISVLADMDANDIASIVVNQGGGAQQTDIEGSAEYTNFSGYLVA